MKRSDLSMSIKSIAEQFIALHAAEELRYFPLLWSRFQRVSVSSSECRSSSILTFAKQSNFGLISPSVLFVLQGVMHEINNKIEIPTIEHVKNAVRTCAIELGASRDLANLLEKDLSSVIYGNLTGLSDSVNNVSNLNYPPNIILSINSIRDIKIDGQKVFFQATQPLVLFCELIRKSKVHWGHSLLLFPKWCNQNASTIQNRFKKLIYKMNMFMSQRELGVKVNIQKNSIHEYAKLIIPPNIKLSGNIIESNKSAELAESFINSGKHKEAMCHAKTAFTRDPEWLKPILLFVKAASGNKYNSDNIPLYMQHQLHKKLIIRHNAISAIKQIMMDYSNIVVNEILINIKKEVDQIDEAMHVLRNICNDATIPMTMQDLQLSAIFTILQDMYNTPEKFELYFDRLCLTDTVITLLNHVENRTRKFSLDRHDLLAFFKSFVYDQSQSYVTFKSLGHLSSYWEKSLIALILDEMESKERVVDEIFVDGIEDEDSEIE